MMKTITDLATNLKEKVIASGVPCGVVKPEFHLNSQLRCEFMAGHLNVCFYLNGQVWVHEHGIPIFKSFSEYFEMSNPNFPDDFIEYVRSKFHQRQDELKEKSLKSQISREHS